MYFVIYDLHDNVIAYIDDINELVRFTGCRKNSLVERLKVNDFIYYHYNDTYRKIFTFLSCLI